MRLVEATVVIDRLNLHPTTAVSTTFSEGEAIYTVRVSRIDKGIRAAIQIGCQEPYTKDLDPEDSPAQQTQDLASWLVFVVNMTTVIRELTNA
jgi:hypothetical protein